MVHLFNFNVRSAHQNASTTLDAEGMKAYGCPEYGGGMMILNIYVISIFL
mgnify:CR=1 FL=1